jgi:hypothetical protein
MQIFHNATQWIQSDVHVSQRKVINSIVAFLSAACARNGTT